MLKSLLLSASLLLPAVAFAEAAPVPSQMSATRASKSVGARALKGGAKVRAKTKRQARASGVAGNRAKGASRRARHGRGKTAQTK